MGIKKGLMKTLWRLQQIQSIIGIFFWSLSITGIFYPYAKWYMVNRLGFPEQGPFAMTGFFTIVVAGILFAGIIYDSVLSLWSYQATIEVERNEYGRWKFSPANIIMLLIFDLPLMIAAGLDDRSEYLRNFIIENLKDSEARKAVSHIAEKYGRTSLKDVLVNTGFDDDTINNLGVK